MTENQEMTAEIVQTTDTINAPAVKSTANEVIGAGVFDLPDPVEVARRAEQS